MDANFTKPYSGAATPARWRKFNKPRLNTSERQPQKEYVQVLDLLMMFRMTARWQDRVPGDIHLRHSDGHQVFCLAGKSLRRLWSARYHGGLAGPIEASNRSRLAPAFPLHMSRLVTELVTISERSAQIQFILNNLYLPHRLMTDPTSCHQSGHEE
jgi:hypothetical protein